jgi:hypothetical protein
MFHTVNINNSDLEARSYLLFRNQQQLYFRDSIMNEQFQPFHIFHSPFLLKKFIFLYSPVFRFRPRFKSKSLLYEHNAYSQPYLV